jgi:imidazolonepropionase-like amidohydrolase
MTSGGIAGRGLDQATMQQFSVEEMRAAFDEAHKSGKRTTVHSHPPVAIRTAIEAGVDCIEHAGLIDRPTAELVAKRGVFVVPTLSALRMVVEQGERMSRPGWLIEACRERLHDQPRVFRSLLEAGCKIVAGVDSLGDLQREISFMVECGMSSQKAIQAATVVAAQCLDIADQVGTLQPGKMADFVAVDGDPLEDIHALRNVVLTVKGGAIFQPDILRMAIGPDLVTDFQQGIGFWLYHKKEEEESKMMG